jgi:1-deoxy-D-xylulose-5-phosphate synthase
MRVKSPSDIKNFSPQEFEQLSAEYRDYLVEVCSKNGGHLGPGLGVIELTLALHKVFNSPQDKILWDIGHQSYPHKLVTGRFVEFQGLREEGGVSGFCRRPESEHDMFGAGHAGTSISAAIGMAEGMRRRGDDHKVIAVIGDAALTAGMAYEGLHQDEAFKKNLIVVLNDNKMSIAPNVGAIHSFLSRQMMSPFVQKLEDDVRSLASKIPLVGDEVVQTLGRVKHAMKGMLVPTVIFEALGFKYYGPFDGHDLDSLISVFENVKSQSEPVLIHIVTEKGRGYQPAIADKETFHGCGPYDKESGKIIKEVGAPASFSKVYSDTLKMLAKADKNVVAITAAMPSGTGLSGFAKELPEQFYDVGICEQHAVTFAGGLALEGVKPHVPIYSTFMQRAYDQVIHDVCIQNLNVKFGLDRAGFVGADGATHNGCYDIAFMRAVPNMHCCAPRDERELQELVVAMNKHEGPACVRYPRGNGDGVPMYSKLEEVREIKWGSGEIVYFSALPEETTDPLSQRFLAPEWVEKLVKSHKKSIDVVLLAYGSMVGHSIAAAKTLHRDYGVQTLVVNARFVKPLDEELIRRMVDLCPRLITVEEHVISGGFGSAVMEFLEKAQLLKKVDLRCLAIPDQFYDQASVSKLFRLAGIDRDSIVASAIKLSGKEQEAASRSAV